MEGISTFCTWPCTLHLAANSLTSSQSRFHGSSFQRVEPRIPNEVAIGRPNQIDYPVHRSASMATAVPQKRTLCPLDCRARESCAPFREPRPPQCFECHLRVVKVWMLWRRIPPPIGTSLWRIALFPWPEHAPWGKNEIAEGYGPQTPPKKFPHPIPPPTSSYLLGV